MLDQMKSPPWASRVLLVAGLYHLLWGSLAFSMPTRMLTWSGVNPLPIYPQFWQCIGMMAAACSIGLLAASRDPYRHWPIVLVGLLATTLIPFGLLIAMFSETLPAAMGWLILSSGLIWWVPFTSILWGAFRYAHAATNSYQFMVADDPLRELKTSTGETLEQISMKRPQMVIFLRHFGCTFCRQTLSDLSKQRAEIERLGCGITLVHSSGVDDQSFDTEAFLKERGLDDLPRISDPECRLYQMFGLDLGGFRQLFGIKVWVRGLIAGIWGGHGIGRIQGNMFQMPGIYIIDCGQLVTGFQHSQASDRPDLLKLARSAMPALKVSSRLDASQLISP